MSNTTLDVKMKEYKLLQKNLKAKEIEIKDMKENMYMNMESDTLSLEWVEDLHVVLAYGCSDFGRRTNLNYNVEILRNGVKWLYLDDIDMKDMKDIKKFTRKLNALKVLVPREKDYILGQYLKQVLIALERQEALLLQDKLDSATGGKFSAEQCYKSLQNESSDILKHWFKILARELHPDKNGNDGTEMQLLNEIRSKFK